MRFIGIAKVSRDDVTRSHWKSRIKRYIDTKPNRELIHFCLTNPPYELGWKEKYVLDSEGNPTTATEKVFETYQNVKKEIRDQLNAEAEAVQIIFTGIDNDIYSTVDACSNAYEMWKVIERLKQGESINVQDLETNVFWEFGKFMSLDGELLESYYSRSRLELCIVLRLRDNYSLILLRNLTYFSFISFDLKKISATRQGMSLAEIDHIVAQRVIDAIETIAVYETKIRLAHDSMNQVNSKRQQNKRREVVRAHTTGPGNKKGYARTLPNCIKCDETLTLQGNRNDVSSKPRSNIISCTKTYHRHDRVREEDITKIAFRTRYGYYVSQIYSKSKEEHEEHLKLILELLKKEELYAKFSRVTVQPVQERQTSFVVGMSRTRANISGMGGNNAGQQRTVKCFNCHGEGHMARQCQNPKRKRDATWFRDKVLLVEAQGNGKVLNEEEVEFLADHGVAEAKAVLMANLSSYGSNVLSEVPHSKNTHTDMLNQNVQEMSYFE
nr:putative reverse transcriptase domain-containing protein [Tanacetum cinerariifolium]